MGQEAKVSKLYAKRNPVGLRLSNETRCLHVLQEVASTETADTISPGDPSARASIFA